VAHNKLYKIENARRRVPQGGTKPEQRLGVYKVRLSRPGEGKSGGYRVIVFFKSEDRTFYVYGFAKANKANINRGELRGFKHDAKIDLSLTDEQINARLRKGTLIEILEEAEYEI
jgi:hypothetical protein